MLDNYNKFLSKRAFLHYYTEEGMEEYTFSKTNEGILKLIAEYEDIEKSHSTL